jgi:tetratricopeptide (TPR) repeat protein
MRRSRSGRLPCPAEFPTPANSLVRKLARRDWRVAGICALLVVLVFLVFGQTVGHDFVNYDDQSYVYENPIVSRGLSLKGIGWAFTHVVSANWHPLTVIVHMLDCEVYGLWAGGHHLTNLLLHAACAVLLFLLLREMTGALWRSGFVAAVFAIHPLRVESVAWVAELKDVLSGLFFMLTLWAYGRYARRPESRGRYAMVMIWLALGLMSKPMLVSVPFVLLLLDYWPLRRIESWSRLPALVVEKLPLFALSALSCVATVIAQKESIGPISTYPLSSRVANALVAYVVYLGKLIYPTQLAVLYPLHKDGPEAWQVLDAILLLAALTAGSWILRRSQPFLLVGWLWYLGMLVPVIGILQVGQQAYADRYTYLPQIGLCLGGTWAAAALATRRRYCRVALGGVALAILCTLLVSARRQTSYWRDSETLWTHTLACTTDNATAHYELGMAMFYQGRIEEAVAQYNETLRIDPGYESAHNNLGNILFQQGRTGEAVIQFSEALSINPSDAEAHYNLGNAVFSDGRIDEAITQYRAALQINPSYADAHNNLGKALIEQGRDSEAIDELEEAVALQSADAPTRNNLAWLLATAPQSSIRNGTRAVQLATEASQSTGGNNPIFLHTLAAAYAEAGQFPAAVHTAQRALQLIQGPSNPALADALRREIKLYEAGRPFEEAH